MNDHELLALAAKAAGGLEYVESCAAWIEVDANGRRGMWWHPLTDDGDALQLAAKLRLLIKPGKHYGDGCTAEYQHYGVTSCTVFRDDPAEQMRRSIVMTAAEIGKTMP